MTDEKIPQGIVAVLISKDGRPIADAADFNRSTPGGFSMQDAQTWRARDALAIKTMKILSSPTLSDAIDTYDAKKIVDKMCQNGCRVAIIPVGYDG